MKTFRPFPAWKFLSSIALLSGTGVAHAALEVPTRVVFHGDSQDMTLNLRNPGDRPSLVQVWIDLGDPDAAPETLEVPFVLSRALVRVEPESDQPLRIVALPDAAHLPQDRETRYFLNLLDIPPTPAAAAHDQHPDAGPSLNLAVHYRLPLLYRPPALEPEGTETANLPPEAAVRVRWSLVEHDGQWLLEADNPTAFSLSMRHLAVGPTAGEFIAASGELLPMARATFPLQSASAQPRGEEPWFVHYQVANDTGHNVPGLAPLH